MVGAIGALKGSNSVATAAQCPFNRPIAKLGYRYGRQATAVGLRYICHFSGESRERCGCTLDRAFPTHYL